MGYIIALQSTSLPHSAPTSSTRITGASAGRHPLMLPKRPTGGKVSKRLQLSWLRTDFPVHVL